MRKMSPSHFIWDHSKPGKQKENIFPMPGQILLLEGGGDRHLWPHQITEKHLCS